LGGCTFHLLDRAGNAAVCRNRKHKHLMYEVMVIDDQDNLSSIEAFKSFAKALSKMDTLYAEQSNKPGQKPCGFHPGTHRDRKAAAYAPELNPVEYMWGQLKTHEIANLIATKAWELSFEATAALRRMRRRRSIIAACYTQADLWP
jgi:hypothetical protein